MSDLVVQLGAKLDQFQSDMDKAGDIADSGVSRIEQSFANLNPGLGGFGGLAAAVTGSVGAVTALLAALQQVNGELTAISKNAEFVGVTVERFQQIQFAAGQGGVSSSQSAEDLKNVVNLLADARQNENSLTRLLDQNNIAYKDRNGTVIDLNQLLTIAGGLINRFPDMAEKTKAAQALGLSQQWVGALHDGADAFNKLAASATDVGAVIDAQTVAKAEAFDKAWQQSSDLLSRQFKATAGEIAAALDGLIDKANDFFTALAQAQGTNVGAAGQSKFNEYSDAIDVARKDTLGLGQDVDQLTRVIEHMAASGGDPDIIRGLEAARDEAAKTSAQIQGMQQLAAKFQFPEGNIPVPAARPTSANDRPSNAAELAKRKSTEEAADAYDRATESVTKYTAKIQAEAETQGQGAAATEEAKAAAQLLTAAQQAGIPITQKVKDQMQDLAQDAGDAAAALAKAKVETTIARGQQTSLLSPEDVQIANQLKDVYPNVAQALASVEASALRTNQAIAGLSSSLSNDLTTGLTDIATGAKTVQQGFNDMALAILKDIEQMIIKLTIVEPLMRSLQSTASSSGLLGLLGIGGSSAGAGFQAASASTLAGNTGGAFFGPGFATGGYTGSGGKDDAAGVVHKGEVVFSQSDVARAGGVLAVESMRLKGYASGGAVDVNTSVPSVAMGASKSAASFVYAPNIDARGTDGATLAKLTKVIATDRINFEKNVTAVMVRARSNNPAFR